MLNKCLIGVVVTFLPSKQGTPVQVRNKALRLCDSKLKLDLDKLLHRPCLQDHIQCGLFYKYNMKKFEEFCKDYINEETKTETIDEASVVTFGGRTFPNNGWCVILAGGPGSGKGYQQNQSIMIDAKVFDVDALKSLYVKAANKGLLPDKRKYDFKNPQDVADLHQIIKDKKLDKMNMVKFFKDLGKLPNIIFDVTGKNVAELKNNCEQVKKAGYKTSLVWVVTNRDVALVQNLTRPRVVPQDIFHKIHNAILANLPDFIKNEAATCFDECWILFGTTKKLPKDMTPEEAKELHDNRAFKLTKNGDGFEISEEL